MPSTIDFTRFDNQELLFGYQRVNGGRFPDNFMACTEEAIRRGLVFTKNLKLLRSELTLRSISFKNSVTGFPC
jgi:hypothetical protein